MTRAWSAALSVTDAGRLLAHHARVLLRAAETAERQPCGLSAVPPRRGAASLPLHLGYAAQAGLYFSALQRIDAALLSLILYTYPVLVTVTAVLLRRDRLTRGRGVALVAASGGILLVLLGTGGGGGFQPVGALLAFGSAVVYTTHILASDSVVERLSPVVLSALVMAGAATTLGVRAAVTGGGVDLGFGWRAWFWLTCIAIVSTVLAMLTFFAGLRRTGPSTTAILSTFEPVVTTALATVLLGESLSLVQLLGGVLVLSSVAILQVRPAPAASLAVRPGTRIRLVVAGGRHRAGHP